MDSEVLAKMLRSGEAVQIDWNTEPRTPKLALELMDRIDAEYSKTRGKSGPDEEMARSMARIRHMTCDLWHWQKEAMRAHFQALANAEQSGSSGQHELCPHGVSYRYPCDHC